MTSIHAHKFGYINTSIHKRVRPVVIPAASAKRYTSIAVPSYTRMPKTIQPIIVLDVDKVPVENEIYKEFEANNMDPKSLLVIGYMALTACSKHLRLDVERRDLSALKDTYDQVISDLKKNFAERSELMASKIISDKDKDIEVLKSRIYGLQLQMDTTIEKLSAEKDKELAMLREQYSTSLQSQHLSLQNIAEEREREIIKLNEQLHSLNNNTSLIVSKALADKEMELSTIKAKLLNQQIMSESAANHDVAVMNEKLQIFQQRVLELESELDNARQQTRESTVEFIKTLRDDEVLSLQSQVAALKGSNFSKGIIGENNIKHWLSTAFTECEVVDKSGFAAESDIHVVKSNGEFIAIECKNKIQITAQDVDKSMRDISHLKSKYGQQFMGYVFISLRSVNIPKKGCGYLEIVNDETPVYWYGQSEFNEYQSGFIDYCKATWTIAYYVRNLRLKFSCVDNEVAGFRRNLQEMVAVFRSTLERLSTNQKLIATMLQNVKHVQDNNNVAMQILNDHLAINGSIDIGTTTPHQATHVCPKCTKSFATKSSLTRHSSKCTCAS